MLAPMSWNLLAASLLAATLAGCAQEMPYRTDDSLAHAIPRERARSVLAELLAKGTTWNSQRYEVVEVADTSFAYRVAERGEEEVRRDYATVEPRLYRWPGGERVEVVLVPFERRWQLKTMDTIWFDVPADAETFIDAIECLKRSDEP